MKKTYTDYLNELSGNRMDILEKLISHDYKKFKKFYKIVSKLSHDIAHVSYRFSEDDSDSLDIDITVNPSVDVNKFIEEVEEAADDKYYITADAASKVIYFSIISV